MLKIKTLLIDNYDSYTFNLYQELSEVNGIEPDVIRNDQIEWKTLKPSLYQYHNIVISPGPGVPSVPSDFGICANIIEEITDIPILGVCLGHQGIGHFFGGNVTNAPKVAHGVVSEIHHDGSSPLFKNIPSPFEAVRYHSWVVSQENFPSCLKPIAWTNVEENQNKGKLSSLNLIMGLEHKERPLWGVQFHPESICTKFGIQILSNFKELTLNIHDTLSSSQNVSIHSVIPPIHKIIEDNPSIKIIWKKCESTHTSENWFLSLYATGTNSTLFPHFWLDSARVESGLSRFSFMGNTEGPNSFVLRYNVHTKTVTKHTYSTTTNSETLILQKDETFFDYIQKEINKRKTHSAELPFDLNCGFVGYFGYEMKHECGSPTQLYSRNPDACFIFADRIIAFDHETNETYFICLVDLENNQQIQQGELWLKTMERLSESPLPSASLPFSTKVKKAEFTLFQNREEYINAIDECLKEITEGESYELCLTNRIFTSLQPHPLELYLLLRKRNPAPYAAFFQFGDFSVLSCSPERFLQIDKQGVVESKPIKGTIRRGATKEEDEKLKTTLQNSKKDFAENLMIVDLIRNDIGKVCEIGSVHVPKLMFIESYATVHQLVTTVRGKLRPDLNATDCIMQSFPPGSMTGAPKLRSMEILERLEKNPRGVYSGILGFFGLNGTCDFAVVIRTAVIDSKGLYIGCGGAIVANSDLEEEFQEILLKANALIAGISINVLTDSYDQSNVLVHGSGVASLQQAVNTTVINQFDAVAYLSTLAVAGMDLGLSRIRKSLNYLGNPHTNLPMIHVTGTNGKGSVCIYLTSILKAAGLKVGTFTSPHLIDWRETIRINNEPISMDHFNEAIQRVADATETHKVPITQFEALTAAMFWYFAIKQKVDVAVVEVGLGGTNDATNVCDTPLASVIVSIGMDHVNVLGNSLASIAREKAGIIKYGRPIITSAELPLEAMEEIEKKALSTESPLTLVSIKDVTKEKEEEISEIGVFPPINVQFRGMTYPLKLAGNFQLVNSALAIQTLLILSSQKDSPISHLNSNHIQKGMNDVHWPARLQWIQYKKKTILIDGAHNVPAALELGQVIHKLRIKSPNQSVQWIIGMLATKDHIGVLSNLLRKGDSIIFVPVRPNVDWLRTIDPHQLEEIVNGKLSSLEIPCCVMDNVENAMEHVQESPQLTVITGSLHLCGQVLHIIGK